MTGWDRFWFTPTDTTTLAAIRICTGLILLYVYVGCAPAIFSLIGPEAWIDDQAIGQLREGVPSLMPRRRRRYLFMVGTLGLVLRSGSARDQVGLRALPGCHHLLDRRLLFADVQRAGLDRTFELHPSELRAWFGLDVILAMLLLYMMFGPTGQHAFSGSADSPAAQAKRRPPSLAQGRKPSWSANVVLRMIQVHLCIVYLCSGLAKLQGEMWWDGTAIWNVLMIGDLTPFDMRWLGQLPYWCIDAISGAGVAATLIFEISFTFLIWNRMLRPLLLLAAVFLHVGIGLFMGLGTFAAVMLIACLAFVPSESLRWFLDTLRGRSSADSIGLPANVPQPVA